MLISAVVGISSCRTATPAQPATSPEQSETRTEEAEEIPSEEAQTLTIGLGRDLYYGPDTWYFLHGSLGVWEPLVILDNDMIAQPVLATAWEPSEEGKAWTFRLREGVTFHDGTPFNADAVLLNIPKLQDEYMTTLPNLDSLERVDDYTVKFLMARSTSTVRNINTHRKIVNGANKLINPAATPDPG